MKSCEEIIQAAKLDEMPGEYNLFEMNLWLTIKQILYMYHNKQINKEAANRLKNKAVNEYKVNNFKEEVFDEHIQNIKKTEMLRISLRELLKESTPVDEKRLCDTLMMALEIISICFGEEF